MGVISGWDRGLIGAYIEKLYSWCRNRVTFIVEGDFNGTTGFKHSYLINF